MKKWLGGFLLIALMDSALAPAQNIVMTKTDIIPRNKKEYMEYTKNINCSNGTYPHYVVSSKTYNETYIVCWKEITIFGFCIEFNFGGNVLQAINLADCTTFCEGACNSSFSSIDSYMVHECYEKYGGVPTREQQKEMKMLKELESIKKLNKIVQDHNESKQSELITAWTLFGISLGANFVSLVIIFKLVKTNKICKGCSTTRIEEKDQKQDTNNDEQDVVDKSRYIEEANTNDFQATSSAVQVSDETAKTCQEVTGPAKYYYDKSADFKQTISEIFMNASFDKSQ